MNGDAWRVSRQKRAASSVLRHRHNIVTRRPLRQPGVVAESLWLIHLTSLLGTSRGVPEF